MSIAGEKGVRKVVVMLNLMGSLTELTYRL